MKPTEEFECCPKFNPEPWEDKIIEWENKKFIREKVKTFFFMPLNFGPVMKKVFNKVTAAGASFQDNLGLSDHTSRWNMDILIAVDKEIPGAENLTLSGKFFSKAYEGPFKDTYSVMANWGANHGVSIYGHRGADLITLASMLRIPVSMHNVSPEKIFRPHSWAAFGTIDQQAADYSACKHYGPIYR